MAKKQKVLQNDSIFNELDVDGDGVITDEEMKQAEELMRLEQERERFKNEDANEVSNKSLSSFLSSIHDFKPYFKNEKLSTENVNKNRAK